MRNQKNNKISICLDNYYIYDFINEVLLYIYKRYISNNEFKFV